jgi:hypothetical protein
MEFTYDYITKWLDNYFKTFNENAGPLETVRNMRQFFSARLEFWPYNMPAGSVPRPSNRDQLLLTMIHPGLHEHLMPREYIVDIKRKVVVVQFQLQFTDQVSGTTWAAKQASAHYTFGEENNDFKIIKIQYWTESAPPEENTPMRALWKKYKDSELDELAKKALNS